MFHATIVTYKTIVCISHMHINPNNAIDAQTGGCPIVTKVVVKTHVFNANLQKQLLSDYDLKSKTKSQEWAKLTANKKALITIKLQTMQWHNKDQDCSQHHLHS